MTPDERRNDALDAWRGRDAVANASKNPSERLIDSAEVAKMVNRYGDKESIDRLKGLAKALAA